MEQLAFHAALGQNIRTNSVNVLILHKLIHYLDASQNL
jgi:hypothetical protein